MLAIALTSLAASAHCADDLESLDEDFLSYLAEFEGEDDDWTIVEPPPDAVAKPAKPSTSETAKQGATKSTAPKPDKPATPDDGSKR